MTNAELSQRTVGLFGTCGASQWRVPFMQRYAEMGIPFFNPQVENWTPELADVEAWHLANDELVLFPVTDETFAAGSLAETGFSVLSALNWTVNRFVVVYIAPAVSAELMAQNPEAAKDSVRARKLVRAHLAQQSCANVFVVDSLDQMLDTSIKLFAAQSLLREARRPNAKSWREQLAPEVWRQILAPKQEIAEATV